MHEIRQWEGAHPVPRSAVEVKTGLPPANEDRWVNRVHVHWFQQKTDGSGHGNYGCERSSRQEGESDCRDRCRCYRQCWLNIPTPLRLLLLAHASPPRIRGSRQLPALKTGSESVFSCDQFTSKQSDNTTPFLHGVGLLPKRMR